MIILRKESFSHINDDCDKLVNQNKEFSPNPNELKREKPNDLGHMLPKYIITYSYLLFYKWL